MKRPYDYLLFDLDGTLTDPMEGITRSVQYALRHFGIEVEDLRTLTPFIGPPLAESFRTFYDFPEERIPQAGLLRLHAGGRHLETDPFRTTHPRLFRSCPLFRLRGRRRDGRTPAGQGRSNRPCDDTVRNRRSGPLPDDRRPATRHCRRPGRRNGLLRCSLGIRRSGRADGCRSNPDRRNA